MRLAFDLGKNRVIPIVFLCTAAGSIDLCLSQEGGKEAELLPMSTATEVVLGKTADKIFFTTVEWEGQEYSAIDGERVLMSVITDPATDAPTRTKALERLGRLRSMAITAQLLGLYDRVAEREEKLEIIRCLISSEDPAGFPLFARVLEREKEKMTRTYAGAALAQWNVRCGVAGLIRVLEECKDHALPDRSACNEASKAFLSLNRRKGWGFAEDRIRQETLSRADLSNESMSAVFVDAIKKWFSENEHRFPDWKPGDPLPEVGEPTEVPKSDGSEPVEIPTPTP